MTARAAALDRAMRRAMVAMVSMLAAACGNPPAAAPPPPTPTTAAALKDAPPAPPAPPAPAAPDAAVLDPATALRPVAMAGPYKSILDACHHASPCGFTDMDARGNEIAPATETHCPGLEQDGSFDFNGNTPDGRGQATLAHRGNGIDWQIASQHCDAPQGLRDWQDVYYMFAHRADGWWRSAALWRWQYNDKYCGGSMATRWNDQRGRTFLGVAAGNTCLTCNKQANDTATFEMMVRLEPGDTLPTVFAPLVVGERFAVDTLNEPGSDCQLGHSATELAEHWPADDELELTGSASWPVPARDNGVLVIGGFGNPGPSTVGRYRFTR
jgi:hypothetical protein